MDSRFFHTALALLAAVGLPCAGYSEVVFNENFDSERYSDGTPLVAEGEGAPKWRFNHQKGGVVVVTAEAALSQPHGAALKIFSEGDLAQLLAMIPPEVATTSTPIAIKWAFQCPDLQAPVHFMVRDDGGETIALLTVQPSGLVQAAFEHTGGRIVSLGTVEAGEWYRLLLRLPVASTNMTDEYQVSLFAADGEALVGSASGKPFSDQSSGTYSYFSVMTGAPAGESVASTVVIDDLTMATEGSEMP